MKYIAKFYRPEALQSTSMQGELQCFTATCALAPFSTAKVPPTRALAVPAAQHWPQLSSPGLEQHKPSVTRRSQWS